MSIHAAAHARPRLHRRIDNASLLLLRAVMADDWQPDRSARQLLLHVDRDRHLLRLLRARFSRALLDRPTGISERAAETLDRAIAALGPDGSGRLADRPVAGIPQQRSRHD